MKEALTKAGERLLTALLAVVFAALAVMFGVLLPGAGVVISADCLVDLECSFATGVPRTTIVNHGTYEGAWALGSGAFWLVFSGLVAAWWASGLLALRGDRDPARGRLAAATAALLAVDVVAVLALDRFFF